MPKNHDHKEFQERKSAGNAAWKYTQKTWAAAKYKATNSKNAPKDKGRNISLLKIFKTPLATEVMLLDAEENHLFEKVINGEFNDISNHGASKY